MCAFRGGLVDIYTDGWIWETSARQCTFETCNPHKNISTPPAVINGLFYRKEIMSDNSTWVLVISKFLASYIMVLYHNYILTSFVKGPTHGYSTDSCERIILHS